MYYAMLPTGEKQYDWVEALVNLVFDNADIRVLNRHATWHERYCWCNPWRWLYWTGTPSQNHGAIICYRFAEIPLQKYKKPAVPGLKNVRIGPFEPQHRNSTNLRLANLNNNIWLKITRYYVFDPVHCPSCSGFNQTKSDRVQAEFKYSPFINQDPNQSDTICLYPLLVNITWMKNIS